MSEWLQNLQATVEKYGFDMKHLSLRAGLGETYVRDILKRGRGPLLANSEKIDAALRVMIAEKEAGLDAYPRDVPLRLTAMGALLPTGLDGIDVTPGKVVRRLYRPPALIFQQGLYALTVRGNSMAPEHRDGDLRFAIEADDCLPGQTVVVRTRHHGDDPGQSYIKRLLDITAKHIVVMQHEHRNAAEVVQHHFVKDYVVSLDRVLTTAELFGEN